MRVFRCAPKELLRLGASTHNCEDSWLRQCLDDVKEVRAISPQLASLPCPIVEPTPWFEFWRPHFSIWSKCVQNYWISKQGAGYPEPVANNDVTTKFQCHVCVCRGPGADANSFI